VISHDAKEGRWEGGRMAVCALLTSALLSYTQMRRVHVHQLGSDPAPAGGVRGSQKERQGRRRAQPRRRRVRCGMWRGTQEAGGSERLSLLAV
jgi:hypothetical protein